MNWRLRDGVVLTCVCEQFVLVGCSITRGKCPYMMQINDSAAFIWKEMDQGKTFEEIKQDLCKEYEVSDDTDIEEVIISFEKMLEENGYIVLEEGNESKT